MESLFARDAQPGRTMLWLTLGSAFLALGALPLVRVNLSVHAAGIVRPAADRVEVHSSTAGTIRSVLVRDNQVVTRDQPLVQLAAPELEERLAHARSRLLEHRATARDLDFLCSLVVGSDFNASVAHFAATISPSNLDTEVVRRDVAEWIARLHANTIDHRKAVAEFERYDTLARRGIASRSERDRAQYEIDRLAADADVFSRQAFAHWQAQLHDETVAIADLESQARELQSEIEHFAIRAPVGGTLIEFNGWGAGGFIASGQTLGIVSPNDELLVEALVPAKDVGLIRAGQPVRVAVDALPYTRWGVIDGTVTALSDDALIASISASPAFKVQIRPARDTLQLPGGLRARLRKGYTVQIRFLLAECTLWQVLEDEFNAQWDPRWAVSPAPRRS
ncbi:MAG TPA: HlyD family efflux transporter periplasmic adaptor subunit [Candidatus Didemnitutus sp.]